MSAEFWAIIGVGVALGGLQWRTLSRIEARIDALQAEVANIKKRLAAVEATLALLVKGLHIEVKGGGE